MKNSIFNIYVWPLWVVCGLFILFAHISISCGWWKAEKKDSKDPDKDRFELLQEKKDKYDAQTQFHKDEFEVLQYEGDTLWLSSIYAIAGGDVNLDAFEKEPGSIYRQPTFDSFESQVSCSNCSYDGIMPYAMARFVRGETEKLQVMIDYADTHDRYMCEGGKAEYREMDIITYQTIKAAIKKLKNEELPQKPVISVEDQFLTEMKEISFLTGYKAHLTMLHLYFLGMIYGEVNQIELSFMKYQAERQPDNALYQAIYHLYKDGDQSMAITLLLDTKYFPADYLPTSEQFCTEYLYQRDEGNEAEDWLPCSDQKEQHRGVDFAIAASIILNNR